MIRIDFLGDRQALEAFQAKLEAADAVSSTEMMEPTDTAADSLALDLADAAALAAVFVAGVEALRIAGWMLEAARSRNQTKLEIRSPTGLHEIDLEGKSDAELARLLKTLVPFLR